MSSTLTASQQDQSTSRGGRVEQVDPALQLLKDQLDAANRKLAQYDQLLERAASVCQSAAEGDLESRITGINVDGHLGNMAHSINHLLDLTDAFVRESGAALTFASEEKFFRRVLLRGLHGTFRRAAGLINNSTDQLAAKTQSLLDSEQQRGELADEFEKAIKHVVDSTAAAATQLDSTASALQSMAEETSSQSDLAVQSATSVTRFMEQLAGSFSQVNHAVEKISDQVDEASRIADEAAHQADDTNSSVAGLTAASQQIERVVKLISQVASQTRLLALNATIEAALAGPAGRGFAVVATEVKSLAGQTAEATQSIESQVSAIREATDQAVRALRKVSGTIGKVQEVSGVVRVSVSDQRKASSGINDSIEDASSQVQEVKSMIQHVTQTAQETTHNAGQVTEAARELSKLAEMLRAETDRFLVGIRPKR